MKRLGHTGLMCSGFPEADCSFEPGYRKHHSLSTSAVYIPALPLPGLKAHQILEVRKLTLVGATAKKFPSCLFDSNEADYPTASSGVKGSGNGEDQGGLGEIRAGKMSSRADNLEVIYYS